ncbi:cell division/cell wall cluster transcriptional repressor MraZ [Gymnodinialimonas sp. 2305UL16-5]|uniref:cell division/cell wall cluster transcriptional repressor MraZ n=1 Tax=Gymnodinialimonas mytili TaxID=3126503 RepID=UPI00309E94AF
MPARFRRALQASDRGCAPGEAPRLHIAFGNPRHAHVECLSGDAFDAVVAKIEGMDEGEEERELLEDLYYGYCEEVQVDDTGRFVLPVEARDKLQLDGEAVFKGRGTRFHILRPEDDAAVRGRIEDRLQRFGGDNQNFNPISLANKKQKIADQAGDDAQ